MLHRKKEMETNLVKKKKYPDKTKKSSYHAALHLDILSEVGLGWDDF